MVGPVLADRGSAIYAQYIKDQLTEEDARKESIEKRGLAVITTSGTIVSLLFGLVAVLTGAKEFKLPAGAEPWLGAALIAFVIATFAGLLTNMPLLYLGVKAKELKLAVADLWDDEPKVAEKRIAATHVKVLTRAKSLNAAKGWILVGAVTAELAAVIFLALAVKSILDHC
jgi:hypothetical protein